MVQGLTITRLPAPLLLTAASCLRWGDQQSKRAYGSKSDAYRVFQAMLTRGHPPDDWEELLKEARQGDDRIQQITEQLS